MAGTTRLELATSAVTEQNSPTVNKGLLFVFNGLTSRCLPLLTAPSCGISQKLVKVARGEPSTYKRLYVTLIIDTTGKLCYGALG
jgi:hypothetical protein